jgi:hypothetical protein
MVSIFYGAHGAQKINVEKKTVKLILDFSYLILFEEL